jgi:SAM-dependent methyltransferase
MTNNPMRVNLILSYNRQAEQRNTSDIEDWKAMERAEFLALLKNEQKQSLLEIGAGHGRDSKFFQENGLQVTCIDLSPEMVRLCQQKGLDARCMDMLNLDFPDQSFDAVYSLNSLLHLSKQELPVVLQNIRRVLKANGVFFLGMYGGYEFEGIWEKDSYEPKRFFSFHSDEGLKQIVTETFSLLSFKQINSGDGDLHFQSLLLRKPTAHHSHH